MNTISVVTVEKIYRNLGFTEEVTECGCCGRVDLKGTYAIENLQTGEIVYLGCVCAAKRMNWSKKEFVQKYDAEKKQQQKDASAEFKASIEYKAVEEYQSHIWELHREGKEYEKKPYLFEAKEERKKELFKKYPLITYLY